MEALALPSLNSPSISCSNLQKRSFANVSRRLQHCNFSEQSTFKFRPFHGSHRHRFSVIRMQTDSEDYDLKQMRDMAAAKKRWESLVREGKVKVLKPREAGYAIQLSDKTLLDVRPSTEHNKAWIKGSTWIPIFDVDDKLDPGTLSRKVTSFMMGGWWSGVPTVSYNSRFLSEVQEKFPKDADLILACQKGLSKRTKPMVLLHTLLSWPGFFHLNNIFGRSLAACELLYNAGYKNIFWVQGGLETAEEEDLVREGPQPLKFAGIGGLSEFLGWTDQQRVVAAKEGWGYRFVYSARLVAVFLAADALFIGAQQLGRYIQELRSH
ncbi:rhodanese-like domain-containing protein 11, chloroplastic isoform X1 [Momordica charantia]|uniref:Rhodanese-like domain-containing protein 11, chloroplastic isoform X1 n=1 Tax=Momordica charantia TaxID=3673 RepID=A0A6J1C0Q2_MOMCH|nr:rhodanese-like domain-containing protein 11, chloroplastic isoform X1 [Momordica charantia]